MEVIATGDEDSSDEFVNALREELDIGDMVEKISVLNNGHRVDFVHDFNDNTTCEYIYTTVPLAASSA